MSRVPRLAVGTFQPGADPQVLLWALMDALRRWGLHVQRFFSQACFAGQPPAASVSGIAVRHLDSWLMAPDVCREVFLRGADAADLSIIEGHFGARGSFGGRLDPLCEWLDLPRLAVVDVGQLAQCKLPALLQAADALLLDNVPEGQSLRWGTEFESLWRRPVLAVLESAPKPRRQLQRQLEQGRVAREAICDLSDRISKHWRPELLLELAAQRDWSDRQRSCCCRAARRRLTVAIAYDEAFHRYFPDTLDALEQLGASVVDFSPLRDECLPSGADVVYLGCGEPEHHAATLSENHCLAAALRSHLRAGRRIYAEGGGAAYLCRQMESSDGELRRMAGIFPVTARYATGTSRASMPHEATLASTTWLGTKGLRLRGYRNPLWRFEGLESLPDLADDPQGRELVVGNFQAVGSLLHLNFSAQPRLLDRFFVRDAREPQPLPHSAQ